MPAAIRRLISDRRTWLLAGVCLLGLVLRLINLKAEPFWGDEVLSLEIARHFGSLTTMLEYLKEVEFHPPLYYMMLHYWMPWFGANELGVRLLSVIFGMATIPAVYVLTKRVFNSAPAAMLAALITAVMPMQIEFSQEGRPYAVYCLFAALSALGLWEYLRRKRPGWLALYIIASALGAYSHYSFIFFIAATCGWWLIEIVSRRENRSREAVVWLAAHAAIFLAFFWWLDAFLFKLDVGRFEVLGRLRTVTGYRPVDFLELNLSKLVWLTKVAVIPRMEIFAEFLFKVALVGAFIWAAARKKLCGPGGAPEAGLAYAGWLLFAPLVLFLLSPQSLSYAPVYQRHVIFATVPIAMIIAYVLSRLSRKAAAALLVLLLVSLMPRVADVVANDASWDYYFQLKSGGAYISDNARPGDLVMIYWDISRVGLNYYLKPGLSAIGFMPTDYYGYDFWNSRETLGFVENEAQVRVQVPTEAQSGQRLDRMMAKYRPERVWLYAFGEGDLAVQRWFESHGWLHPVKSVGGLFLVDLYSRK